MTVGSGVPHSARVFQLPANEMDAPHLKDGTSPVATGVNGDDRQVRPGPTKPGPISGLTARSANEAWVSGFHRGQRRLPRNRSDIELRLSSSEQR
jgi:hypothetical protein